MAFETRSETKTQEIIQNITAVQTNVVALTAAYAAALSAMQTWGDTAYSAATSDTLKYYAQTALDKIQSAQASIGALNNVSPAEVQSSAYEASLSALATCGNAAYSAATSDTLKYYALTTLDKIQSAQASIGALNNVSPAEVQSSAYEASLSALATWGNAAYSAATTDTLKYYALTTLDKIQSAQASIGDLNNVSPAEVQSSAYEASLSALATWGDATYSAATSDTLKYYALTALDKIQSAQTSMAALNNVSPDQVKSSCASALVDATGSLVLLNQSTNSNLALSSIQTFHNYTTSSAMYIEGYLHMTSLTSSAASYQIGAAVAGAPRETYTAVKSVGVTSGWWRVVYGCVPASCAVTLTIISTVNESAAVTSAIYKR